MAGMLIATVSITDAYFAVGHLAVILWLSLAYAGMTFQQPMVFAACLDIGGARGEQLPGQGGRHRSHCV